MPSSYVSEVGFLSLRFSLRIVDGLRTKSKLSQWQKDITNLWRQKFTQSSSRRNDVFCILRALIAFWYLNDRFLILISLLSQQYQHPTVVPDVLSSLLSTPLLLPSWSSKESIHSSILMEFLYLELSRVELGPRHHSCRAYLRRPYRQFSMFKISFRLWKALLLGVHRPSKSAQSTTTPSLRLDKNTAPDRHDHDDGSGRAIIETKLTAANRRR